MAWDFSTDPEFAKTLEWMREFVDEHVLPIDAIDDLLSQEQLDALLAPLQEEVRERGLWAAHLDKELGGQGMGQVKLALMHEILGRTQHGPSAFGNMAPDSGNAELIAVGATEEQKDRWLWPLLDGKLRSSFSMTEAHVAGSDPTLIQTAAVRDGNEWVINGHKWFASNADVADFIVLMAVTDPDAPPQPTYPSSRKRAPDSRARRYDGAETERRKKPQAPDRPAAPAPGDEGGDRGHHVRVRGRHRFARRFG